MMNKTRMMLLAAGAGAAAVLGGSAGAAHAAGDGSAQDEAREQVAFTEANRAAAAVSETDAVAAAVARHPGTPSDVHLENEGGGLRWEVKTDDGTKGLREIQLDARTGAVVSDQADD